MRPLAPYLFRDLDLGCETTGIAMLRYTGSATNDYCLAESQDNDAVFLNADARPFEFHGENPSLVHPARAIRQAPEQSSLAAKLGKFVKFGADEIAALDVLSRHPKLYRADQILIHEGSPVDHVCLIVKGLACRYKMLVGGRRQIMGYLIPGDICDVHFVMFNTPDHSVALVGDSQVVNIPTHKIRELTVRFPAIERALSLAGLVDCSTIREWLLNIGQRDAMQKLSHFFCEMSVRLKAIDQIHEDGSFELPTNQATLADTIGLTPVHINRTLQRLRTAGLIRLCQRRLTILDASRLAAMAGFDGNYLRIRHSQV